MNDRELMEALSELREADAPPTVGVAHDVLRTLRERQAPADAGRFSLKALAAGSVAIAVVIELWAFSVIQQWNDPMTATLNQFDSLWSLWG